MNDLYQLTATEAVALLKDREVSPLELVEASIDRIEETDGKLNAIVTRCYERARNHAKRLMQDKPQDWSASFLYGRQTSPRLHVFLEKPAFRDIDHSERRRLLRCHNGLKNFQAILQRTNDSEP